MAAPQNERRRHPRRKPPQLVYLEFGRENGGMVKDVSEGGMRFHLMGPVAVGQSVSFGVTIDASRRIEGQALMAWTDASGKSGGMAFTELSQQATETLLAWLAEIDGPAHVADAPGPAARPTTMTAPSPVHSTAPSLAQKPAAVSLASVSPEPTRQAPPIPVATAPAAMAEEFSPTPQTTGETIATSQSPALVAAIAELETALRASSQPAPKSDAEIATAPPIAPPAEKRPWEIPMALPGRSAAAKPVIAEPVSRGEWQEAAREEITPGRRRVPGMNSSPNAGAGQPPRGNAALEAAKFAAIAEQVDPTGVFLKPAPTEANTGNGVHADGAVRGQDSLRDFLKQPLGMALDNDVPPEATTDLFATPRSSSPRKSRVGVILAAAAIAAALVFVTVAYRQAVGELLIKLGEKLSGESRGAVGSAVPGATPAPPANEAERSAGTPVQREDSANSKPAPATKPVAPVAASSGNSNPNSSGSAGTPSAGGPAAQERTQPVRAPTGQTELAAGREVVPGKPRPLATDLDALWLDVENGNTAAEIELANRYASGEGVQKNCDQARVLLQAAAKRGSEAAAKRLAEMPAAGCQ